MNKQERLVIEMALKVLEHHTECYEYPEGMVTDEMKTIVALREILEKPMSKEPVAWFKHGPYEDGEELICVFQDPKDDACYSPLGFIEEDELSYKDQNPVGKVKSWNPIEGSFVVSQYHSQNGYKDPGIGKEVYVSKTKHLK